MIIYVVTTGSYSDYQIRNVTDNPLVAEKLKARYDDANDIEIYDTDEALEVSNLPEAKTIFYIFFKSNGDIESISSIKDEENNWETKEPTINRYQHSRGIILWTGPARDREHAIKLATERRVIFLAEESQRRKK